VHSDANIYKCAFRTDLKKYFTANDCLFVNSRKTSRFETTCVCASPLIQIFYYRYRTPNWHCAIKIVILCTMLYNQAKRLNRYRKCITKSSLRSNFSRTCYSSMNGSISIWLLKRREHEMFTHENLNGLKGNKLRMRLKLKRCNITRLVLFILSTIWNEESSTLQKYNTKSKIFSNIIF
jgi:hypothetical protein